MIMNDFGYFERIQENFKIVNEAQGENIKKAAELMFGAIKDDKLISVYGGGGHTTLCMVEMFFRGGALSYHPHIFDMIRHITGSEFDSIYAEVAPNIRPDIEEEDMLAVIGKMKDGTVFSLDPSWSKMEERLKVPGPGWELFPKRMEVNITINGDKGTLMSDCFGPNVYHNGLPNDRYTIQYTYFDEWVGLIDEFYDNIREKKTPLINLRWHKKTIEAMNAVYESISTGKSVKL